MTQEHPVTPPLELVREWQIKIEYCSRRVDREAFVAEVFQLGSDYELKACCDWISMYTTWDANRLRTARRPKQQSLKEQALEKLAWIDEKLEAPLLNHCDAIQIIRRALEQLND